MKRTYLHPIVIFTLAILLSVNSFAQTKGGKPLQYKKLQYGKLRQPQIPEPFRFVLANGMIVYLLEDHTLPTVNSSVMVRSGLRYEPQDKLGVYYIAGQVMRTGGTTSKTGDELDEILERVGASVETYVSTASAGARLSVLKEDVDLGFDVLADVLMHPAFRDDKIELAKITARSSISRRNDQVMSIGGREFAKLIYGAQHPYGRVMEYATIENITKQDLIDFHKQYFIPNAMMIAVWGDFKTDDMKARIEKVFGGWERGTLSIPTVKETKMASSRLVNYIKKDDVNQAYIYIGHLGGLLNDPQSPEMNLADQAFGGGFASRLFKKVRSDQGLAYSVGSMWGEGFDYPGMFRMSGSTKSGTMMKMVKSMLAEYEDIVKNGITDAELKYAKETYLNSYVFEFESKANVINKLMTLEYFGYPKDYYQKQIQTIETATKQSVNDAVKNHWKPDNVTILVVGNDKDFDQPLSELGKVTTIDITIPAPPEKFPEPAPATLAAGKEILRRSLSSYGGAKLLAVKDLVETGSMKMTTPMGEMEMQGSGTFLLPNMMVRTMKTPMGEMMFGFDGKIGWIKMPMGIQEMPASQAAEMQKEFIFNQINVLQNIDKPEYAAWYYKADTLMGKPVHVVLIKHVPTNATERWYVDTTTSLIVKSKGKGRGQAGPADEDNVFEDYRDINGVKIAHKVTQFLDGKKTVEMIMTSVKTDIGVTADQFKKPEK